LYRNSPAATALGKTMGIAATSDNLPFPGPSVAAAQTGLPLGGGAKSRFTPYGMPLFHFSQFRLPGDSFDARRSDYARSHHRTSMSEGRRSSSGSPAGSPHSGPVRSNSPDIEGIKVNRKPDVGHSAIQELRNIENMVSGLEPKRRTSTEVRSDKA